MYSEGHLLLLLLLFYFRSVKNLLSKHRLFFTLNLIELQRKVRWVDMWYVWERREMYEVFWLGNLKERGCLKDVGVDGRTC